MQARFRRQTVTHENYTRTVYANTHAQHTTPFPLRLSTLAH